MIRSLRTDWEGCSVVVGLNAEEAWVGEDQQRILIVLRSLLCCLSKFWANVFGAAREQDGVEGVCNKQLRTWLVIMHEGLLVSCASRFSGAVH